jgi:hypothetical protein
VVQSTYHKPTITEDGIGEGIHLEQDIKPPEPTLHSQKTKVENK